VRDFLTKERGLTDETLARFGLGLDDGVASFPYPKGDKFRRHDEDGTRHFWSEPKGVSLGLFKSPAMGTDTAFLVEGETDAMRLWQEAGVDVFALPGIEAWDDAYASDLQDYEAIFVVLDNDLDYKVQARVENTWHRIRKSLGKRGKRIRLPEGVKDLCEFFDKYNLDALRILAESGNSVWHYEALDLAKNPGPIDWLVEDLVAKGDLALAIGEPGVGKSWIGMSLAVAVASRWDEWLGRSLHLDGSKILYVDEENPEPLVLRRLHRLGLTQDGMKNIRFLHRQGIRLDRAPELLLDEALDWEPDLIVLDSLTRMHTKDENNAGEVAKLFNDGINPLARETGATTLLLHHVTKTDSSSSFFRARGSGDISASVDTGLDVRNADEHGGFRINLYKSRWIEESETIRARREDVDDHTRLTVSHHPVF